MAWTTKEIEKLRQLWAEGNSGAVVAQNLGKSRNAVIGMVFRLDLPKRATLSAVRNHDKKLTSANRCCIRIMYKAGISVKEIAAEFGVSHPYICMLARRSGLTMRRPRA